VGTGGLEDGSPQRGSGAEPWWRSGGKDPRSQICIIQSTVNKRIFVMCSCIEDIRRTFRLMRSLLPHPIPPKKHFEFVQISRPTLAEVG